MVWCTTLRDMSAPFVPIANTSIPDRTICRGTSEYTTSTRTRTIHSYEMFWPNGQMDQVAAVGGEVDPCDVCTLRDRAHSNSRDIYIFSRVYVAYLDDVLGAGRCTYTDGNDFHVFDAALERGVPRMHDDLAQRRW